MLCVISVAVFVVCISIVLVVVVGNMLHAFDIVNAVFNRDFFLYRQFYFDCYPRATFFDAEQAYKRDIARIPARLARASRQGPLRPWSNIPVGPRAVNRESELQLSLPL